MNTALEIFKRFFIQAVLFGLVVGLFMSCSQNNYMGGGKKLNLAAMYYPMATTIHPVYKVFHNSDNTSLLYAKIFTSELMFAPSNIMGESISRVDIKYTLFEAVSDTTVGIADSGTYNYTIDENIVGKRFYAQIPVKAVRGKTYQLKVFAEDKLRKAIDIKYIDVNKQNEFNSQNYNFVNHSDIPFFTNVVKAGVVFKVKTKTNPTNKIFVKYYKHQFKVPKPTYAYSMSEVFKALEDSLWVFDYTPELKMQLSYEGFYLLTTDTAKNGGLVLSNYGKSYPKVSQPEDMVEPLQYIAIKKEYDKILDSKNKKLAIDRFWIEKGNGIPRGKELIRIFYNRVYFSNYYFTTGVPGWASDRGMVYVMYGPPQKLERVADTENWYYWVNKETEPVRFSFKYAPSDFFSNNYVLLRNESQNWHWQDALVAWRNGKIYLQD